MLVIRKFYEDHVFRYKYWKSKCCLSLFYLTKCRTLDKTISNLEMELAAARALQDSIMSGSPITQDLNIPELTKKRKYLMVIGINTAFSSRKRRDSVRATWMPQGSWHFINSVFLLICAHVLQRGAYWKFHYWLVVKQVIS